MPSCVEHNWLCQDGGGDDGNDDDDDGDNDAADDDDFDDDDDDDDGDSEMTTAMTTTMITWLTVRTSFKYVEIGRLSGNLSVVPPEKCHILQRMDDASMTFPLATVPFAYHSPEHVEIHQWICVCPTFGNFTMYQ